MAASGLKVVLPWTFTDTSLPVARDDAMLPAAGALVLFDANHSLGAPAAGVADQLSLPNVAAAQGIAMDGGAAADWAGVLNVKGNINNGVVGKLERTGKAGIHGILSQAQTSVAGDGAWISVGAKARAHMNANPAHDYYYSVWDRLTRINPGAGNKSLTLDDFSSGSSNTMFFQDMDTALPGVGVSPAGTRNGYFPATWQAKNVLGPRLRAVGFRAPASTSIPNMMGGSVWGFPAANLGGYNSTQIANRQNAAPSYVWYRTYMEDLTVSGRTFAQCLALDQARQAVEFAAGGRFYNDTFTDPATLA